LATEEIVFAVKEIFSRDYARGYLGKR